MIVCTQDDYGEIDHRHECKCREKCVVSPITSPLHDSSRSSLTTASGCLHVVIAYKKKKKNAPCDVPISEMAKTRSQNSQGHNIIRRQREAFEMEYAWPHSQQTRQFAYLNRSLSPLDRFHPRSLACSQSHEKSERHACNNTVRLCNGPYRLEWK